MREAERAVFPMSLRRYLLAVTIFMFLSQMFFISYLGCFLHCFYTGLYELLCFAALTSCAMFIFHFQIASHYCLFLLYAAARGTLSKPLRHDYAATRQAQPRLRA